ncbi:Trehalose 6-phosphate phosphorylase [Sphingobium chlorophenolicum]|uniref:Trehalose 6-phosphate phosphorylase n=1 Tax=Sphingobium chlorophenolicum TaxID=46429 RepID=A0A081RB63_SPHCR|nr:Trehalose 6-phosphate phosphorylase [Sphingobium chlorophenolicum]
MPILPGSAILNGVVGLHAEELLEAAIPVPYPLCGDIGIGEAWLSEQPWAVSELEQSYDFSAGELSSSFRFRVGEHSLLARITTFASRSDPALVLQQVELTSESACQVRLRATIGTANVRGHAARRMIGAEAQAGDGALLWIPEGGMSSCGIAFSSECRSAEEQPQFRQKHGSGPLIKEYRVKLKRGRPARLQQVSAMIPSIVHHQPDEEAVRRLAKGLALGFDRLRALNREHWQEIWQGRILVEGASSDHQRLIDAGFFYLNSSAHRSSPAATSMFGLASWPGYNYYYGHVMWDIDAFCVPPLLLVQPGAAQSLLDFRARHVDAARAYAKLDGHDGMRFPWQAAPRSGEEATPGAAPAAANAAHVSLHVARAFALHADVTGDSRYLRAQGWPILSGVADWLAARISMTDRGANLLRATGPAEVPDPPDNDSFTLMTACDLLRRAIRLAKSIDAEVPASWHRLLDRIRLPVRSDGVIAPHRDFRVDEEKGATPSSLAGLFPMHYPASDRERKATLDFFLARWRDYVGSPMLPAFYPAWAAMAGDRGLALALFEEGYAAYDKGRFHQCLEYREDHPDSKVPAGPFMANIGGMLMTMLMGLPGLEITGEKPAAWARRAVVLPSGWKSISVDRLCAGGRPMRLVAEHGKECARLVPT